MAASRIAVEAGRGAVAANRDRQGCGDGRQGSSGCGDSEQGSLGGMCRPAGVVKGAVAADRGRQGCGGGQQLCAASSKVMNDHYYMNVQK